MTSAQLSEWLAYYRLEPWDSPWGAAAGSLAFQGDVASGIEGREINGSGRPVQTPEQQLAIVEQLNALFGGRDERNK